jgi:hypothetical protein
MARTRTEDLHGFDRRTALEFALNRTREAYLNGYEWIEFEHGAADVVRPVQDGRGSIKWELRAMLERGDFEAYCLSDSSWDRQRSLRLTLRPNGWPRPERWSPAPARAYRQRRAGI